MKQLFLFIGCGFGLDGARALSETLKGKTKLTSLYLWGEQNIISCFFLACITFFLGSGNNIGDEGARALCDMIRANTALNDLNLGS